MKVANAAQTLFNDPGRKSQAIAKIIMVFAKRLHANDGRMAQLSNLMASISASSARAPASAEGGGGVAPAEPASDVAMGQPGTASADGGGDGASAIPVLAIDND
eukprot:10889884-Alexandrium_andersonii.AAC.1